MTSTLSPLTVALRLEQAGVIIDEALRLAREPQVILEVFEYDLGLADCLAVVNQRRYDAAGVQSQIVGVEVFSAGYARVQDMALPFQTLLGQRDAHLARGRGAVEVIKLQRTGVSWLSRSHG